MHSHVTFRFVSFLIIFPPSGQTTFSSQISHAIEHADTLEHLKKNSPPYLFVIVSSRTLCHVSCIASGTSIGFPTSRICSAMNKSLFTVKCLLKIVGTLNGFSPVGYQTQTCFFEVDFFEKGLLHKMHAYGFSTVRAIVWRTRVLRVRSVSLHSVQTNGLSLAWISIRWRFKDENFNNNFGHSI